MMLLCVGSNGNTRVINSAQGRLDFLLTLRHLEAKCGILILLSTAFQLIKCTRRRRYLKVTTCL